MDFDAIQSRRMTESEYAFVSGLCREIYSLLNKWKNLYQDVKFRVIKSYLLSYSNEFEVLPEHKDELVQDQKRIALLRSCHSELGNRNLDITVLECYSDLALKFAHRWYRDQLTSMTVYDLAQEAYLKIYQSLYSWNPDGDASLTTYLHTSIGNCMSEAVIEQGFELSPINTKGKKIVMEYNKFRKQNPDMDAQEAVQSINLTDKQKEHLRKILVCVRLDSNLPKAGDNGENNREDYSCLGLNNPSGNDIEELIDNMHVNDILDASNLTPMERKVLIQAMNPYYGWQSDIAESTMSDSTGQQISRCRVGQYLDQAKAKVKRTLLRFGIDC